MSTTGSTREIATRFALPFGDAARSLWNSLSARLRQPAYRVPLDGRLLRDIGIAVADGEGLDVRLVAAPDEDPLASHGLSAQIFENRIRQHCRQRSED